MKEILDKLDSIDMTIFNLRCVAPDYGGFHLIEKDVEEIREIVKNCSIPVVVGQSEQYTCECKVCGKPFDNNEDYYRHYDEEHN